MTENDPHPSKDDRNPGTQLYGTTHSFESMLQITQNHSMFRWCWVAEEKGKQGKTDTQSFHWDASNGSMQSSFAEKAKNCLHSSQNEGQGTCWLELLSLPHPPPACIPSNPTFISPRMRLFWSLLTSRDDVSLNISGRSYLHKRHTPNPTVCVIVLIL